jgi:transcriptional regulator with XRE-family HTH domain
VQAGEPYELPMKQLAEEIKGARQRAGLTQRDVAEATGYSLQTVKRWEAGEATTLSPWAIAVLVAELTGAPRQALGLSPTPDGAEDPALLQPQIDRLRSDLARLAAVVTELSAVPADRTARGQEAPPRESGARG